VRILLGVHQFPPFGSGGTEQLARWSALGLSTHGHAVAIASAVPRRHAGGDWRSAITPDVDGLDVRFLEPATATGSLQERIVREYEDEAAGIAFGAQIDRFRPDVIHFFHLAGLTASAAAAARERGVPYLFTASDYWYECPTVQLLLADETVCAGPREDRMNCATHLAHIRWPRLPDAGVDGLLRAGAATVGRSPLRALQGRSAALRETLSDAAAVLAPNEFMRTRLRAFGVEEAHLRLVPYPVPDVVAPRVQTQGAARMRVVFVGTLAPSKGAHVLLEAMRLAADLDVDLDVYGEASDADYDRRLRALAGSDRRIRFAGTFASDAFADVVNAADLLVVPSIWYENSPLVLLQALALRCPVLVADVPGLAPHVRGLQDGWKFERGNAQDLAQKLRAIANDANAREAIRRTTHESRTMASYLADLEAEYAKCVLQVAAQ